MEKGSASLSRTGKRAKSPDKAAKAHGTGFTITEKDIVSAVFVIAGALVGRVLVFEYMNPAVIAYLSVFLGQAGIFYLTSIAALIGLVTNVTHVALVEYLTALALLGASNYVVTQNRVTVTDAHRAVIAACCIFGGGIVSGALDGMNAYLMIISSVEAVVALSLSLIFTTAYRTIMHSRKKILTNEQLISISALMGVCFVGMAGISIGGVHLRDVLSLAAILILSHAGGAAAGAACGLIFSIIMFAGARYPAAYTGILGVAGIMSGVCGDFGKFGSGAGFAAGITVAALYLDRTVITPGFFLTLAAAELFFLLLPQKVTDRVAYCFMADKTLEYGEYLNKIKEVAGARLSGFSDSFKLLSNTFSNLSEKKNSMSQKDVSRLIDKIAENACRDCRNFDACWKNNFYTTYQAIFLLLAASDKKGYIAARDIPESFKSKCIDLESFSEITNRIFLVFQTDVKWHNRLIESRELVSQQLLGVSEIMSEFSRELDFIMNFNNKLEKVIREQLEKHKIGVDSLIVLENKSGRYEVDLTSKSDSDLRSFGKNVLTIISDVLGRKMTRESSVIMGKERGVRMRLVEAQRFNVTTGVSRAAKNGEKVSGDNYTWMELRNGRSIVALSDGMGSGVLANEESKATIEILEQFLESGFDKELAIKMINSILVLKSDDDFFTTLDLLCIDLYTGVCEIVKIGAVETFLLRDGKVKVIRQPGLPAGIFSDLDIQTSAITLKDGDIILVASDGVTDAANPDMESEWIIDALEEFNSHNPQYIAEYILERAKAFSGGKAKDDMTALALRFWTK